MIPAELLRQSRIETVAQSLREDIGDGDITAMLIGFWLARRLPIWASVMLVIGFEALTTALIRDGLALNILMLLHPMESIREWQGAL